jgi:hypothetical protein
MVFGRIPTFVDGGGATIARTNVRDLGKSSLNRTIRIVGIELIGNLKDRSDFKDTQLNLASKKFRADLFFPL